MEWKSLELSRQKLREKSLSRFRYIKTCVLARELCLLVRTNRVALDPRDVEECCRFVSGLCGEARCIEQSELCKKASEIVVKDENDYLKLCQQSCLKCGEARQPASENRINYVA